MKSRLLNVSSIVATAVATLSSLFVKGANAFDWKIFLPDDGVNKTLPEFIKETLTLIIGLAALVAVVMLVAAGFKYITANGDEGKIKSATSTLTFAIVGLVICFIAIIIVQFVLGEVLEVQP